MNLSIRRLLKKSQRDIITIAIVASVLCIASVSFASIVSGASTTSASVRVRSTVLTLSKPSAAVGDLMLASIVVKGGTEAVVTATPAGWNQILRTDNDDDVSLITYWKVISASEPNSYTWSFNGQTAAEGAITPYSGVDVSNPIDNMNGNSGLGKIATAPAISLAGANEQVIAVFGADVGKKSLAGAYFSTVTGMMEKYDVSNIPFGPSMAADDSILVSSGNASSKSSTISGNKSRNWVAQQISLRQGSVSNPIVFDASTQVFGTSPSLSITRGTSATNYIGLATLACVFTNTVSSVTWGGNVMTKLMDEVGVDGNHVYWFYITNPSSGAQAVSATTNGNCSLGALSYSGVNQVTPFDTNFDGAAHSYVKNLVIAVPPNTELTTTGTTHLNNSLALMAVDWQTSISPGTNATERLLNNVYDGGSVTSPAGNVSLGVVNSFNGNQTLGGFMIALQPIN